MLSERYARPCICFIMLTISISLSLSLSLSPYLFHVRRGLRPSRRASESSADLRDTLIIRSCRNAFIEMRTSILVWHTFSITA
jgi:hypothetical protein